MSATRSRTADWASHSDPYGYSPYDSHAKYQMPRPHRAGYYDDDSDSDYHRRARHHSPKSQRSSRTSHTNHDENARKAERGRRHSPQHDGRNVSRRSSTRRDGNPRDADESGWDTDYDARDKYHLSGDEQPSSAREKYTPKGREHGRPSHRSSHGAHSTRPSTSRQVSSASTARGPSSSSRPSRPRAVTRGSSYTGRPRSARYPPNASRSGKARMRRPHPSKGLKALMGDDEAAGANDNAWETAVRSGAKAAAIAALRVSGQKGSIYEKLPKVATAALGAAVVDSFLTARHPGTRGGTRHSMIRSVAELAIGNLVSKPAAKGIRQRRHG